MSFRHFRRLASAEGAGADGVDLAAIASLTRRSLISLSPGMWLPDSSHWENVNGQTIFRKNFKV
jgi:hypothetical protein